MPTAVLTAYQVPGTWATYNSSVSVAKVCDNKTCISCKIEESTRTLVVLDVDG